MISETALILARIQFAFTIGVHIIFPAFSIGLAAYLVVLEAMWLKTHKVAYLDLYHYWLKIFAVGFGMGVVSGVVMSYEFGTNWAEFSVKAGPITGPLLAYEVLTAFFLEAGFLGIMLFGMGRVGKGLHFFATCMVSLGTLISMTWILASNSWMQTPAGYVIDPVSGKFLPQNWLHVIFNPSFPYRLVHMGMAAFLSVGLTVGAVAAYHLLKAKKHNTPAPETVRIMFVMAMGLVAVLSPLQMIAGDAHGLNTMEHQPAKVAAMEGDWVSQSRTPWILFGIPDMEAEKTKYKIEIPFAGSLILTHSLNGVTPGMKDFPKNDRPPSPILFFSFRIMVALATLMLALGVWAAWAYYRKKLYDIPLLLKCAIAMGPAGYIALLSGWVTTEVGRQPFTVYGLLRTENSVSPTISSAMVATSMTAFVIVYVIVFGAGLFILLRMMTRLPPTYTGPRDMVRSEDSVADITQAKAHTATMGLTHPSDTGDK